jgi:membrane-associated protease RseP (regulator of RpoE activity)
MLVNSVVTILLMSLLLICFFQMIKGSIDLAVFTKKKSIAEEEREVLLNKYQSRIFKNIINIFLLSGCITFFFENKITTTLLINMLLAYLTLNFIICMHEFGHYAFGKKYGLKIEAFTIGIGNTIFQTKLKETTFTFKLVPFLGFVKPADKQQFISLNGRQRILFFSGGLFINFILYILGVIMVAVGKGHSVLFGFKAAFTLLFKLILSIVDSFNLEIIYSPNASIEGQVQAMLEMSGFFSNFWIGFASINLLLFLINLLPIAPLDGGHIFKELMEKTLKLLRIPKKVITIFTSAFIILGLLFFGTRAVINNGWAMFNDLQGRWIEFSLWMMLLISIVGYFTQRRLDKK